MIQPWRIGGRLGNQMFQLAYLHAQMWDGINEDIYLQDPKYFGKYAGDVKKLFGYGIMPVGHVAIHVRRTDYVGNEFYVDLLKTGYYEKAMDMFPDAKFLVFSDDIEYCKKLPIFEDCEFSEEKDEIKDFNLMAGCEGHIIANSSFSWWAAYVSPFTRRIVAPKSWYADGKERTKCPHSWIRI